MRIVCDLDGTIFKTYDRLARCFQIHFKYSKSLVDLVRGTSLTDAERDWVINYYFNNELAYISLPVYKDADTVALMLAKQHEIIFVTARPFEVRFLTAYELAKLHLPVKSLFFVHRTDKAHFVAQLNPDWVIEDETPIAIELALRDFDTILMNRDWNIDCPDVNHLYKVSDWLEVTHIITKGGDKK